MSVVMLAIPPSPQWHLVSARFSQRTRGPAHALASGVNLPG